MTNTTTSNVDDRTPWKDWKDQIKTVVTTEGASVDNCRMLFDACTNLVSADLSKLDTSNATIMSYMFYGCSSKPLCAAWEG